MVLPVGKVERSTQYSTYTNKTIKPHFLLMTTQPGRLKDHENVGIVELLKH